MKTYMTLYEGETRAASIYVRDQNDTDFIPTSATSYIKDSNDIVVVMETPAAVSGSSIIALVDTVVTSAAGDYDIVWRINQEGYTYIHVSSIKVVKI